MGAHIHVERAPNLQCIPAKGREEEERLYHKGQQSSKKQHDQPISHKLTKVASGLKGG
jgi:hypothetical protein